MYLPKRLDRENGKEYAYRVLKDNIMSLELKPGQSISETELAQELGISRTPIREVLMKLKEEHLIEVKPQIGTYVSLIDRRLVEEAFFMRYHLEKEAMKLACTKFPEDKLIELEKSLMSQRLIAGKQKREIEFHKLDIEFHGIIFSGVNLEEVWNGILKISTHYNRLRLIAEIKYSNSITIEQHEKFVEVIKNNDFENAQSLVTDHLEKPRKGWKYIFNTDSEYKDYFKE
ncbi:DNA-binding GntR family transcriptional regulator [Clostridium algifaecis]|uniref:DNA-binding GntR family transcriptional regulator n=1 Tax=Clostridium algifaecis TaxID=1472040 RepID=A0ABS4KRK4_9CLOT|nr:GntR family transcriptional regulator [Clostridium algifaecis]MBP2032652.1 DNA-binding GntR family transcriptional regulator [Clostridium algifaecis]